MGAVTYPNAQVAEFIDLQMVPIQVSFDSQPLAKNFNVQWTPTIITLDGDGKEHHRTVGFLPPEEFVPSLMLGVGKSHFDLGNFSKAIAMFEDILKGHPKSDAAPEAVFVRGVALYKSTHKADPLKAAYNKLLADYPSSEWVKRAKPYSLL
jgi:tetratricopeptide (TPR) repeat protein